MLTSRLELKSLSDKALFKIMEIADSETGAILIEHKGDLVPTKALGIKNPKKINK